MGGVLESLLLENSRAAASSASHSIPCPGTVGAPHDWRFGLATLRRATATDVLLGYLEFSEKLDFAALGRLLLAQPKLELAAARARIVARAQQAEPAARKACWAAVVLADGSFDAAWREAESDTKSFADLLAGIPMIGDAALRATAYPRLASLIAAPADQPARTAAILQAAIRAAVSTRQEMAAQFHVLGQLILRGEEIPVAAQAIRGLAHANWNNVDAGPLTAALIAWAKKSPESARRGPDYLGVTQLAGELAQKLPAAEAADIRKVLAGSRTATYLVRAVPEEMRFDVPRLVVEPAKVFTIVFENPDAMPHNLVVVKPGTREKVGQAALELRADFVDRLGRAFVPETSDVVAATKLLDPGQSASIRIDAPLTEGEYEYVCTFPGHWVTMWGKLIVTSIPETALASPGTAKPATSTAAPVHQHDARPVR